MRINFWYLW